MYFRNFRLSLPREVKALQFHIGEEVESLSADYFSLCTLSYYDGKTIEPVPSDLLGTPKDAFWGFSGNGEWQKIEDGDWIIEKDEEYLLLPNSLFQLLNNN